MRADELKDVIDKAMALVRGEPYAQGAGEDSDQELWPGDFEVGYRGEVREVGYPDRSVPVIELDAAPNDTMALASGALVDWHTPEGVLGAAAVIAGYRMAAAPLRPRFARSHSRSRQHPAAGLFFLSAEQVDQG